MPRRMVTKTTRSMTMMMATRTRVMTKMLGRGWGQWTMTLTVSPLVRNTRYICGFRNPIIALWPVIFTQPPVNQLVHLIEYWWRWGRWCLWQGSWQIVRAIVMSVSNSTNPLPPRRLPDVHCRVYWKYIGSKKRNVILRTRIKIIFWCERFLVPSSTLKRIHSVICMVLWHLVRVLNQGKTFYPPSSSSPPLVSTPFHLSQFRV